MINLKGVKQAPDGYVNQAEAIRMLGVCEHTIRRLVRDGKLSAISNPLLKSPRNFFQRSQLEALKATL